MLKIDNHLSETDIRTKGSVQKILRCSTKDQRDWIEKSPVSESLKRHNFLHLGFATMKPPFEIVRMNLGGSYFLAGIEGQGRVIVDGRWKKCKRGQAFLLPPGTMHAFEASPEQDWSFCWVRFKDRALSQPIANANSPVLASFNGEAFRHAVMGLYREATTSQNPEMELLWVDVIYRYVQKFAEPRYLDARLLRLFENVEEAIAEPRSNQKMAAVACIGERQLERLCLKQLGRTPRQHLIWLRMHKAANLLSTRDQKVESIAAEVGYANPFTFSNTFKRYMGWPPSTYPRVGL